MKISVIIPAFNEEKYLSKTLEAILAQDYSDFEVILVDNGSMDRTSEIAGSFPKVKVLHESRKGTMWACECGRKEAKGELIVRMDADCLPYKDWLSKGAAFFANQDIVCLSGPYDYYDASPFFRKSSLFFEKYFFSFFDFLFQILRIRAGISMGGNTFLRASAIAKIGGFNTDLTFYGDDTDVPTRMSTVGKVIYSRKIIMPTSARRYKNEGLLKLQTKYFLSFIKGVFSSNKKIRQDNSHK